MREQLGATLAAGKRLAAAHVELARSEFGEIMDEVKRTGALIGLAIASLTLVGFLLPVGLTLFLGEWLFGSIGWGVLHGTLSMIAVAVAAVLVALGVDGGRVLRDLAIAAAVGVVVGVVLALNLSNEAWAAAGAQIAPGIAADVRPLVVGTTALAIVGAVIGLIPGVRAGEAGQAVAGLVLGGIVGAIVGAISAIAPGLQVGAAIGVAVALGAWPVLMGSGLARRGLDGEALKRRFWPAQTIDTTKETIEWVRAQTPLEPKS